MRLICPNCVAQYEVDEGVIPPEGRDVQCANCGHNWFQDSIQMLPVGNETPAGTGDPDSDVPPELFNDLEGKLDTEFTSARARVVSAPKAMEPEESRNEFQTEQKLEAPSSRLDKSVLDVLRSEAEYSSGEKPPAVAEMAAEEVVEDIPSAPVTAEPPADSPAEEAPALVFEHAQESVSEAPTVEVPETVPQSEKPSEPTEDGELNQIRRRIIDMKTQEDRLEPSAPVPDYPGPMETLEATADAADEMPVYEKQPPAPAREKTDHPAPRPRGENPFSRPTAASVRAFARAQEAAPPIPEPAEEPVASEPVEPVSVAPTLEDAASPSAHQDHAVGDTIDSLVSEQIEAESTFDSPQHDAAAFAHQDLTVDDAIDSLIAEQVEAENAGDSPQPEAAASNFQYPDEVGQGIYHETGGIEPSSEENLPMNSAPEEPRYQENIPFEEDIVSALAKQDHAVDDDIESLISEQFDSETTPDFGDQDGTNGGLYGASGDQRKDMLPDVDELSSEIASDAAQGGRSASGASAKSKGGFLGGIKYAILFCLLIGILYTVAPVLSEYVPQTAGVLNVITNVVDTVARLLGPLVEMVKVMINDLIG